jgi:hypothetical protein
MLILVSASSTTENFTEIGLTGISNDNISFVERCVRAFYESFDIKASLNSWQNDQIPEPMPTSVVLTN